MGEKPPESDDTESRRYERSRYGIPQHEIYERDNIKQCLYGNPQHETATDVRIPLDAFEPQLRPRLFPSTIEADMN